ncbi:hypothetical protein HMN09_00121000 [Mycena chlorophos]|uniref:Uncharacterized protein n=1 Tax=Mycena chlorophos TaxID=658473 RepID=A0A8H6WN62_MYCCL|nr:hypothetical protein HMN09_00121000 [Mycena chlorophos]
MRGYPLPEVVDDDPLRFVGLALSLAEIWASKPPRIDLTLFPTMEQPTTSLSLFSFPAELRCFIYEEALGFREIRLFLQNSRRKPPDGPLIRVQARHDKDGPSAVALLQTCRQVYLEAYHIPLAYNTLRIAANDVQLVLTRISQFGAWRESWTLIRSLVVDFGFWFPSYLRGYRDRERAYLDLLPQLPNLSSLVICFDCDDNAPETHLHGVSYNPRMLLGTSWAQAICAISSLRAFRIEFVFRGVLLEIEDERWAELEKDILHLATATG